MVTTSSQNYIPAYDLAQKTVQSYAPLIKGSRLPSYRQPEITLKINASCQPEFAALMKPLHKKLDLADRSQFSDDECQFFRYHRFHGLRKLYEKGLSGPQLYSSRQYHENRFFVLQNSFGIILGEKLMALIGKDNYDLWFPWNDFCFCLDKSGRRFTLHCESLSQHVAQDGRPFYYSPKRYTATIGGKTRIVAFSPHAIQRIAERTVLSFKSYANLGDIFAFVNHCQYFEPAMLYPQQDAFSLFERCLRSHFSSQYAYDILDHIEPKTKYAYRVGYCPVVEEGEFFLAKTVLLPGYNGTPEYGVLLKASLAPAVKEQMLERCKQLSYSMMLETQDFSLLRWFHTHGVPQVITYTTPLFDHDSVQDSSTFNLVE